MNTNQPAIDVIQKRLTELEGSIKTSTAERNQKVSAIHSAATRLSVERMYNNHLSNLWVKLDCLNEVLAELQALPLGEVLA